MYSRKLHIPMVLGRMGTSSNSVESSNMVQGVWTISWTISWTDPNGGSNDPHWSMYLYLIMLGVF